MKALYEALLANDASQYLQSHAKPDARHQLLKKICADLKLSSATLQRTKPEEHSSSQERWGAESDRFMSLIAEECRHIIAEALHRRWHQSRFQNGLDLYVDFQNIVESRLIESSPDDGKKTKRQWASIHVRRGVFEGDDTDVKQPSRYFSAQDRQSLTRPGTVIELHPVRRGKIRVEEILLGTLSHQVWTEQENGRPRLEWGKKAIMLYSTEKEMPTSGKYRIFPLTSLLSYARQFDATYYLRAALYPGLMQVPAASDSDSDFQVPVASDSSDSDSDSDAPASPARAPSSPIVAPRTLTQKTMATFGGATLEEKIGVPHGVVGYLIGLGGESIARMQRQSSCRVQIQQEHEVEPGSNQRVVTLTAATAESIAACRGIIEGMMSERLQQGRPGVKQRMTLKQRMRAKALAKNKQKIIAKCEGDSSSSGKSRSPSPAASPSDQALQCKDDERSPFTIPPLNECQEKAMAEFLASQPGSITLVQGPPGTGKSTMITATVCKYLLERRGEGKIKPRLMVCAPSNKAVTVLASRYMDATDADSPFRIAMVGDKDKMLSEDHARFKDVFVYAWLDNVIQELRDIVRAFSDQYQANAKDMQSRAGYTAWRSRADALEKRLCEVLPAHATHPDRGVPASMKVILDSCNSRIVDRPLLDKALKTLIGQLKTQERYIQTFLLGEASVIFCTLSSAGASIVKDMLPIGGLIIDEAAAATEPETYIPMALSPKAIMIVGDPKQLPATIMSRVAGLNGLGRSLQERLMLDENLPYTMLQVQYRMRPEIGCFPSTSFYDGHIANGPNVTSPSYRGPVSYRNLASKQANCFVQVDGMEARQPCGSFHNSIEAERIVALLIELNRKRRYQWYQGAVPQHNSNPLFSIHCVRVITFYQAQVKLIKEMLTTNGLNQIAVSTVDSCQGSEAELVLISFVRTGKMNSIGFLSDNRRLNVALTRAKYKLICVGNSTSLAQLKGSGTTTMTSFVKDAKEKQIISKYVPRVRVLQPRPAWVPQEKRRNPHPNCSGHIAKRPRRW